MVKRREESVVKRGEGKGKGLRVMVRGEGGQKGLYGELANHRRRRRVEGKFGRGKSEGR